MRIAIKGIVYDSAYFPVVVEFNEEEQKYFNGMKKYVSTPFGTTEEERSVLLDMDFSKLETERFGPNHIGEGLRKLQESLCGPIGPKGGNTPECIHKNIETWNHGYHSRCKDCGELDV